MMRFETISPLLLSGTLALALSPLGCASDTDDNVNTPTEEGSAQDELKGLVVTEADADKTIKVTEGQNVVVKLKSNATTGYQWKVTRTDRTFAYPSASTYVTSGGPVGSGGLQVFTWNTKAASDTTGGMPMSKVGIHEVQLSYARSGDAAPEKTFAFKVEVVSSDEQKSLEVTEADADKTVKVTEGQNVVVKLKSNATTGYQWKVTRTDRTFAYPSASTYVTNGGAVGSEGLQVFTWNTKAASDTTGGMPVSKLGTHEVQLSYARSGDAVAEKTFAFKVEVVSP